MLRFLKISPECVCESWNTRLKFTVKLIYCSYEALTTHSIIIAKFQHFFIALRRSFLHFPVIVHFFTHSHEAAASVTAPGLIIILSHMFICDENS